MLPPSFDPNHCEDRLYKSALAQNLFTANAASDKQPFCVMMPPPNVTGNLHLGHALNSTIQDILIRFKKMSGYESLFQPGTDHAGIATQMVVERNLSAKNITRHDLGREKFLEEIWKWKHESGGAIVTQQKRLGLACDWQKERFTMDEGLCEAVTQVFVTLYKDGIIYRDKRLVNWDTKLQTAISDLEVLSQEVKTPFYYIRYPLADNPSEFIVIATTRPETLFGDMAVAVHPGDERYQHLVGKKLKQPFTNLLIPIIADTYCELEKGTGAVKITPAHDFNDFEVGKRNKLELLNIMTRDGHLNESVPKDYVGLSMKDAREKIVADLESLELIEKIEEIQNTVPYGDRSNTVVEPYLTDQWFVDAKKLSIPALEAVKSGKTSFFPELWSKTYYEWLENIEPWCISRQIWWGHQVPAWFTQDGDIFVEENEEQAYEKAREKYGNDVILTRDEDVLDTWFSSALWPFSTLGWPKETGILDKFYPTSVLVTGFDIIFFWVARMMMMGLYFKKEIPFKTIYIHALVRDEKGAKMSKSKGNVINPIELIDEFGADALRFTMSLLCVPGRDVKLGRSRVELTRNFTTKIWNAAKFLTHYECELDENFDPTKVQNTLQQWILIKLSEVSQNTQKAIDNYRFDEASKALYHFIWGTYCDIYLEFLKPLLQSTDERAKSEAKQTALYVFVEALKLFHPFMPFITDELYQYFKKDGDAHLLNCSWPSLVCPDSFKKAYNSVEHIIEILESIRSLRSLYKVAPQEKVTFYQTSPVDHLDGFKEVLKRLARLEDIQTTSLESLQKTDVQMVVNSLVYAISLEGLIDVETEKTRLTQDLKKLEKDLQTCEARLNNQDFMSRAKEEVIDEMKERAISLKKESALVENAIKFLSQ